MRARDEEGRALPPPHKRLPGVAALEWAGVQRIAQDGRSAHLPLMRRLRIVRKAIDHVVDGDTPPAWLFKKDLASPSNTALADMWRAAVDAVRDAGAAPDRSDRP